MNDRLSFPHSPIPPTAPVNAINGSLHREVCPELLPKHRKPGEVPYPLEYTSEVLNFDTIDHHVLSDLCGGLTLQNYDRPPSRVLDLGCGGGLWIMSAAAAWPNSTFVGLDIYDRQPDLTRSHRRELAERIRWVKANFLEPLPFRDREFDLVRIQNIGLGVPEDEWQAVVEEIVRVLKPGGVLEVVEEDLIFPCAEPPEFRTPRASPTLHARQSRSLSRSRGNSWKADHVEDYGAGTLRESQLSKSRSLDTVSGRRNEHRDHTRLKESYMQMLSSRFINSGVLTILPFYLQSAFQEVQIFPPVKFYLPAPTGAVQPAEQSDPTSSTSLDSSSTLVDSDSSSSRRSNSIDRSSSQSSDPTSNYRARMHLARTLAVMRGCMEALWVEYEKLYRFERAKPNTRLDRDDFEGYFYNWECDMLDRIGMREVLKSRLGWEAPPSLPKPDWKTWREKGEKDSGIDVASYYSSATPEVCRSVRGFVCKRPIINQASSNFYA